MNPRPSFVECGKFLGSIAKKKQYSTVVSLCNQMNLFGVTHNVYSLNILINCLCRFNHVHFAVSTLGKTVKLGMQPNAITFNTLNNGLCIEGEIKEAVGLFNEMVRRRHEPDVISYTTVINGLCKTGNTSMAVHVYKMEQNGCKPDVVTYNTIMVSPCKDRLVNDAMEFLSEMVDRSIPLQHCSKKWLVGMLCQIQ
jgi:pentatricopeptide repeat protein